MNKPPLSFGKAWASVAARAGSGWPGRWMGYPRESPGRQGRRVYSGLMPIRGVVFRPLAQRSSDAEICIAWRVNESSPVIQAFFEVAREVISGGVDGLQRYRR